MDFRTSGALSSFAWSCRGNGGGRVRAPVEACKKINNLEPSYRHTGVAIGTSAKTDKKSTEHGACLLRGQCSRASVPRLSLAAMKSSLVELMAPLCGSLGAARRPPGSAQRKKQRYGKIPLRCAEFFFFWLTAKNVSRDRRNSGFWRSNCGGNTEDIAVELAIEEMCGVLLR